jgi:hypothetical protein
MKIPFITAPTAPLDLFDPSPDKDIMRVDTDHHAFSSSDEFGGIMIDDNVVRPPVEGVNISAFITKDQPHHAPIRKAVQSFSFGFCGKKFCNNSNPLNSSRPRLDSAQILSMVIAE